MLLNLHVKNFALIEESDVDFGEGLNILTGETGAGKSILIDAVTAVLGGRTRGEMIRTGCDNAYVEATFSVDTEEKRSYLKELGVDTEYDCITVSRKMLPKRSIHKINGESVSSALVRQVTASLLDIHGQHEHQSLMNCAKHLEVLDAYGGEKLSRQAERTAAAWHQLQSAEHDAAGYQMDAETRLRQIDFLQFEIQEIDEANVRPGETEELESRYRRMQNSQKICEHLGTVQMVLDGDSRSIRDLISAAMKELSSVVRYDEGLEPMQEELASIEDLAGGLSRELEDYLQEMQFDGETFREIEERLDLLHRLESKYGDGYEQLQAALEERQRRLEELEQFEINKKKAEERLERCRDIYSAESAELSKIRRNCAPGLEKELSEGIAELNFSYVDFRISFREAHPGRLGTDEVEFLISLNPGEPARPLGQVASGGELSRIMLAIKTVLADRDEIPTLIFDEIDTGISGRTAQKVSEKLNLIGRHRQVICITPLPQIASRAARHYDLRKVQEENHTRTNIRLLNDTDSIQELARLLGGAEMTETVYQNAVEMKMLASRKKEMPANR